MDLYRKHRPKNLNKIVGNEQNIAVLQKWADKAPENRPNCYLFVGSPGCGKTTLAYILSRLFGCTGDNVEEYNSASFRGIDSVREIQQKMQRMPTGGSLCRCFILEEAHRFTNDAMEALLKPTENCPTHVYFMLTTTNPEKLTPALKQRMKIINVESLSDKQLIEVMSRVLKLESETLDSKVLKSIASASMGSARMSLALLEKVLALPSKDRAKWQQFIEDTESKSIDLCRLLMKRPKWPEVVKMLATLTDDPESVRRAVLGYANSVLLRGNVNAYDIISCFKSNYYDTGKAGLSLSCFEYIFGTEDR